MPQPRIYRDRADKMQAYRERKREREAQLKEKADQFDALVAALREVECLGSIYMPLQFATSDRQLVEELIEKLKYGNLPQLMKL